MNADSGENTGLDRLLNRAAVLEKSGLFKMLNKIGTYFWLRLFVRKKSHRARIIEAMRLFHLLQQPEFQSQPGRLFAYVRKIDPFVFEELLLLALKSCGLNIIHNKRYTGDGGIDGIVILPSKHRMAVQAKRYKQHINVQHLKAFVDAIENHHCHGGFFIHCGKSGQAVYQNLPANIILISGRNLHRLLSGLRS